MRLSLIAFSLVALISGHTSIALLLVVLAAFSDENDD